LILAYQKEMQFNYISKYILKLYLILSYSILSSSIYGDGDDSIVYKLLYNSFMTNNSSGNPG
jgi:hypothetical protein